MSSSRTFVIETRQYSISVKVFAGQGDGDLIYLDASGHIHHVGPNPAPFRLTDKIRAAVKQIETGLDALAAETRAPVKSAIGA